MQLVNYTAELSDQFLELGRHMHAESTFKHDPWSDDKIRAIAEHPSVFYAGLMDGDKLIAFFLGCVTPQFFGPALVASDMAMYVQPDSRGGLHAVKLIKAFEQWAKARAAKCVNLGQSTGINIERTRKFYERMGYKTVGFNARKDF